MPILKTKYLSYYSKLTSKHDCFIILIKISSAILLREISARFQSLLIGGRDRQSRYKLYILIWNILKGRLHRGKYRREKI